MDLWVNSCWFLPVFSMTNDGIFKEFSNLLSQTKQVGSAPCLDKSANPDSRVHFVPVPGSLCWVWVVFVYVCRFYTPVWKTDVLCRGNVRPSVCTSVRPSVRPRFPDFSWTCFEISIWNLVYTFSRWHDVSSFSCITIGSLWPSLQPKVDQTHFLQSWPHKSR